MLDKLIAGPPSRRQYIAYGLMVGVLLVLPLFLSDFRLALVGKYLAFAVAAVGLDLLWGYAGVLSLGHAVFFSLGAYSMAMHMKLQSEALPDFMVWSGLEQLPWFWEPFRHFAFALPMAVVIPAVFAIIIGYPTFRSGIRGVYFSILTQAMALAMSILFIGQQPYTGGTNGMTNFQSLAGISLYNSGMRLGLYLTTVVTLVGVVALALWLVKTRTGTVLMAIRDGENRLRFLGYNPVRYKLVTFALSAGIAGLAGALFVPQVGIISPSSMSILPSVEMAIWVAVGGRGTIVGAAAGAVVVNWAKTVFSESLPEAWLYVFGGLFIGVVLLFPRGLAGIADQLRALWRTLPGKPAHAPQPQQRAPEPPRPPAADGSRNHASLALPVVEPVAAAAERES